MMIRDALKGSRVGDAPRGLFRKAGSNLEATNLLTFLGTREAATGTPLGSSNVEQGNMVQPIAHPTIDTIYLTEDGDADAAVEGGKSDKKDS
ncbi:hypothetical protein ATCC90586_011536 [Pythium insidiosum]|nr:hypothetical protein ATCC90586_011536 [Pythium insidiosum]